MLYQQQQENMSNLTSASVGDKASVSSGTRNNDSNSLTSTTPSNFHQSFNFASPSLPPPQSQPPKKRRNLPGNPDPEAEVIALSPKTLMAKNRFVCEICNKGFQRDQNLQLHRRGHNLPWKLKQRANKEVIRKKVYVCPEPTCVHHDPSRALGDLTGIKKHFSRKHGEKKWKCEKCSKKYAVQSDWKAHSKTCGTREYRCDCGTLFSRRDSFITHRAFCDALAEESARATITGAPINPLLQQPGGLANSINLQQDHTLQQHPYTLKQEPNAQDLPPWLGAAGPGPPINLLSSSSRSLSHEDHQFTQTHQDFAASPNLGGSLSHYNTTPPFAHMSATALLQKAAQMGSTMSSTSNKIQPVGVGPYQLQQQQVQQGHVSADSSNNNNNNNSNNVGDWNTARTTGFGLNLSSREEHLQAASVGGGSFLHGNLSSFINTTNINKPDAAGPSSVSIDGHGHVASNSLLQDMINMNNSNIFGHHDAFVNVSGGVLKKDGEEMTRDFLGLGAISHTDFLNMAALSGTATSSSSHHHQQQQQQNQSQKSWQG